MWSETSSAQPLALCSKPQKVFVLSTLDRGCAWYLLAACGGVVRAEKCVKRLCSYQHSSNAA